MTFPPGLEPLATAWRERNERASRVFVWAGVVAILLGGAHAARLGTLGPRAVVAAAALGFLAIALFFGHRARGDYRDARRTIDRVLIPTDRELGGRVRRALGVVDRTHEDETVGSSDLAHHHFERLLGQVSVAAVDRVATRRATRWRGAAAALAVVAAGSVAIGPTRVVEGLDVLCAWRGRAPIDMQWLEETSVSLKPPSYLRIEGRSTTLGSSAIVPEGTIVEIRGKPILEGRRLVVTDGETELPFVGDGSGHAVARWPLEAPAELRVAARFGDVTIHEPESLRAHAFEDDRPRVRLRVRLPAGDFADAPIARSLADFEDIEIEAEATDDYGLEELALVLRAGSREDRRLLAKLDGESRSERRGHILFASDAFLRRMFVPVQVTVEARDNDPRREAKWGSSAPLVLMPMAVGASEAKRLARLESAQRDVAALVAWLLSGPPAGERAARVTTVAAALRGAVAPDRDSLPAPAGLATFVIGQAAVLARPIRTGGSSVQSAEDVLLAIDKVTRALAARDARTVSKSLSDVAEEAADGAKQARESETRLEGITRLDAALDALDAGIVELGRLGALGLDIGAVAKADSARIRRARGHEALAQTEQAARHLAARLRRPNPSFGASGAARGGAVESGALGTGDASGEPSQTDRRFDQLAREIEQVVEEHRSLIETVEHALLEAEQAVNLDDVAEEAKERAAALRRSTADLPLSGAAPGSARSAATLGKEHANAMAQSLEQLSIGDAVESGTSALAAIEDAESKQAGGASNVDPDALERAKKEIEQQLGWAKKLLRRLEAEAEKRSRSALSRTSADERELSQRASNLGSRGRIAESALPEELAEALERASSVMAEAARAFGRGDHERGLARQREAQRLLEQSDTGETDRPSPAPSERRHGSHGMRKDADVPGKDEDRAEAFKKRVLDGLGRERGDRLSPAVKRYAESLLE